MAKFKEENPFADIYADADPNNPFADIYKEEPTTADWVAKQMKDVIKQGAAGLVVGAENVAAFPAQVAGLVAPLANKYLPGDPEATKRQAELLALTSKARGGGIAQYLPDPETRVGSAARSAGEFIPSVVAGGRGSIPRAAGVGATTGIVSDVAGQATEGTAAEPWARLGGAVIAAPLASRYAGQAATRADLDQLRQRIEPQTNAMYDQFRQSGFQLTPQAAPSYAAGVRADLNAAGYTDIVADRTHRVLDSFTTRPWREPQEFQAAYQQLGRVASAARDGQERAAAHIAQERLLGWLENVDPRYVTGTMRVGPGGAVMPASHTAQEAVQLLQTANANWAALRRADNLSGRITRAEQVAAGQYSGLGLENELRRRVMGLADPTSRSAGRGFSPDELASFERFGRGGNIENIRRWATGVLGGRGGIAFGGAGLGGAAGVGYLTQGDPTLTAAAGAAPFIGMGLAMRGNRASLARARDLERSMLLRSPAAASLPAPFAAGVPLSPTLGTLGLTLHDAGDGSYYYAPGGD